MYLLAAALFILPLAGPVIFEPIVAISDLWTAKEFLAIMAVFAIVSRGKFFYKHNPFLTAFLLFLPISAFAAPPFALIYGHENMAGLWIWRSMAWCFAYYLLYCALPPVAMQRHKDVIAWAIKWAAVISAGYAYIQAAGLDQWQITRAYDEIGQPAAPQITALIGNPTYLAVWLVICLPFLRGWWILFVVGAVVLCKSDIAMAGVVLEAIIWGCLRARSTIWLKAVSVAFLTTIVALWGFWAEIRPKLHDNGRFAIWAQTFEDWKSPCIKLPITDDMSTAQKAETEKLNKRTYTLTGRGLGSFPFIFSPKYGTKYDSAHNEYLEGLYSIGLIGMGLFLAAIGYVLRWSFLVAREDTFYMRVYTSFLFICFASAGLPILHLEPLRFYSAIMFILLSRR